jgi:hypothetical protein
VNDGRVLDFIIILSLKIKIVVFLWKSCCSSRPSVVCHTHGATVKHGNKKKTFFLKRGVI